MSIPLTGFTFPSDEQEDVKKTSETISFPDEMVKSENGSNTILFLLQVFYGSKFFKL